MSRSPAVSLARIFSVVIILTLLCGITSAQDSKAKAKPKAKAPPTTKLTTKAKGPVYASPEEAEKDAFFAYQGEFKGDVTLEEKKQTLGVQVIARGTSGSHAVLYYGGLPGDGWKTGDKKEEVNQTQSTGLFLFSNFKGALLIKTDEPQGPTTGPLKKAKEELWFTFYDDKTKTTIEIPKVTRTSPTIGAKPPKDAIVLFDGTSTAAFEDGTKMTDDKLLMPEAITKQKFQSFTLHAEFRTPFQPEDGNEPKSAQHRGNSGIYLQNRYEIQILDSFGLEPKNDYCGGFYKFHVPMLNMCFPPLSWQTYDIDFTAAKYDGDKKVKNARLTAKLNGVVIHNDIELVSETAGSLLKESPEPGGLLLQQHGNPVRFKNIWIVEKK